MPVAGAAHLREILDQLVNARRDAMPLVTWPGAEVRRYRDALYARVPMPAHDASRVIVWDPGTVLGLPHGRLEGIRAQGRGLSLDRQGGERFRPDGRRHSTSLKKLLQTSAVPPWSRDGIPLIYVDGELAAVAGLWVAAAYAVDDQGWGWLVSWTELSGTAA